jgi:hypothetical protein
MAVRGARMGTRRAFSELQSGDYAAMELTILTARKRILMDESSQ